MFFSLVIALVSASLFGDEPEFCVGGTVLNALTGEPVRRAAVTIPQSAALSDAAGAFRFCQLPAGWYYANAEKPGFVASGVRVAVGPSREDVVLRLQPLSVITGKVVNADGEPLQNALIQMLSIQVLEGRRKVRVESAVATDDPRRISAAGPFPGQYYLGRLAGGRARRADVRLRPSSPCITVRRHIWLPPPRVTGSTGARFARRFFRRAYALGVPIRGAALRFSPLLRRCSNCSARNQEPSAAPVRLICDSAHPSTMCLRAATFSAPRREKASSHPRRIRPWR